MKLSDIIQQRAGTSRRLVMPEGCNSRILRAARILQDSGDVQVTLLGHPDDLKQAAGAEGVSLDGISTAFPETDGRIGRFTNAYREGRPRTSELVASKLVKKPLFFGGMMVREGFADALLAGAETATARVVEAGLMTVGLQAGIVSPSSFFLMLLPQGVMIFADCALTIEPTAEQLAGIAITSAGNFHQLTGGQPRVALLSFSTHGSAKHALVDKVRRAVEIAQKMAPGLLVEGEMQLDAALDPAVAGRKIASNSQVAGQANVLIFPDLNSGNIAYKLARYLTGAQAIGPILQGFSRPVGDLSRSASVEEIVATAQVLLAQ